MCIFSHQYHELAEEYVYLDLNIECSIDSPFQIVFKNTLLYIQLEEALFQGEIDYISKVAKTPGEICVLIEAGFEYVTEFEGLKFFRKRKT